MAETVIPPRARGDETAAHHTDHELVSFAMFLNYRARRMRAPVAGAPAPDAPTTHANPPAPKGGTASKR